MVLPRKEVTRVWVSGEQAAVHTADGDMRVRGQRPSAASIAHSGPSGIPPIPPPQRYTTFSL